MFASNERIAEKYDYLADKFTVAYKWLKDNDITELSIGVYPLSDNPEEIFAQVQEYTTAPWSDIKYEAHDKYFDIHYMVSGDETIGVCRRDLLEECKFVPEDDMHYFVEPEKSSSIYLKEGDILVVAPEDAHKPRVCADSPIHVKKVVVKVLVEA